MKGVLVKIRHGVILPYSDAVIALKRTVVEQVRAGAAAGLPAVAVCSLNGELATHGVVCEIVSVDEGHRVGSLNPPSDTVQVELAADQPVKIGAVTDFTQYPIVEFEEFPFDESDRTIGQRIAGTCTAMLEQLRKMKPGRVPDTLPTHPRALAMLMIAKGTLGVPPEQKLDLLKAASYKELEAALRRIIPDNIWDEFEAMARKGYLPPHVQAELDKEQERLRRMPPGSQEAALLRDYIDFVSSLPWEDPPPEEVDIARARQVLDEDHYNLERVKHRVLEHLAVMKLNPTARAPILCFVGPPGVGKTSLGRSIAYALRRRFERIALGGLHDEAELRGHRRTYVGAMPGRIIKAIQRAGKNAVILFDEVDKIGRDHRGDPAAALLEILDPEQNKYFRDNYVDIPFDLSKVLFIATANTTATIPPPLLDRMEVIRLNGYSEEEKAHIATHFLVPKQMKEIGLTTNDVEFTPGGIRTLIHGYTREAGVRSLERVIAAVCRRVALEKVEKGIGRVRISAANAHRWVSEDSRIRPRQREPRVGVTVGLAWSETGGSTLDVEAVRLPGKKEDIITGHLGQVMRESVQAARSWLLAHAEELGLHAEDMRGAVHVHVSEGATPKDGPSAGLAIVAALVSLFTRLRARCDVAFTGEITLTGEVLPVGGLKEKILAARRDGIRHVVLPADNREDVRELSKLGIKFTFVRHIREALPHALEANNG
jgi:ATP-dependent Lon protease